MNIGIVGAGAVGVFFGALLKRAGHDVIFLARREHLKAMQKNGLYNDSDESFFICETFTDSYKEMENVDLVLFTVKSAQTKEAALQLRPYLKTDTMLLTLQNGIDNEEVLGDIVGDSRIISGAAYITTALERPGVIKQAGKASLVIGGMQEETQARAETIARLFEQAGIYCKTSDNIKQKKWDKLLWKKLRYTAECVLDEAVAVGKKLGIMSSPKVIERIFTSAEKAGQHKTSMLQDRERGKQMEIESLCGYFVHKGSALHAHTPVLHTLYSILSSIEKKGFATQ
nr:2-dehydropantoate 2-reductase [Aneurinibacillus terranovensis]